MNMPFYVSPEQLMKDRADYARKGIGRGRSVAVVQYVDGILFVSENPSQALHKISEIYDRIGFAAVGRYNEFENLRIAGVRLADLRGYSYDRRDVTGRGLANAYAQTLGSIFSSGGEKPYEVELFVAELGTSTATDQIFRLTYDGQVADERGYAAMGGQADSVTSYLSERWRDGLSLTEALRLAVGALGHGETGADRTIPPADLEVAVLDRTRTQQRKFRRIGDALLAGMLDGPPPEPPGEGGDDGDGGDLGPGPVDDDPAPVEGADPADVASAVAPVLEEPITEEEPVSDEEPVAAEEPVEETPVEETPVEELTNAPAYLEEAPAEETSADGSGETPVDGEDPSEDPAEVASPESPLTELDVAGESVEEAATQDSDAAPTWSQEDWPPVAPPLPDVTPAEQPVPDSAPDSEPESKPHSEPDSEDLWPLEDETAVDETTPASFAESEPDQESTALAESPAPRADRPPPPPISPAPHAQDSELTEDLEQEWSEEDASGSERAFDLYDSGPVEPDDEHLERSDQPDRSDRDDHDDHDDHDERS